MSWLTVKIGRFIHDALKAAKDAQNKESFDKLTADSPVLAKERTDPTDIPVNQTQFTVMKVANGKLVKVSEYKPTKSHHSDWTHEIYIVKDDEKVPDVIARIMAIKALEQ
jgi:hypothetical protein